MSIYLYLKTHNKTGLKYLGKTTLDPFVYKGSGVRWKHHIAKHGYDVTTEILLETDSIEEIKAEGMRLSAEWNVVESDEFANLMEENGIGGKNKGSFVKGMVPHNKGKKCSKNSEHKKAYWRRWREENPDYKSKWKQYQRTGRTQEGIKAHQRRAADLNTTLITCPHCGKTGNIGNMNRWHLDNCKMKKDD